MQQRSWGGQRKKRIDAKKEEDICFSKKDIFFGKKDIFFGEKIFFREWDQKRRTVWEKKEVFEKKKEEESFPRLERKPH